MNNIYVYIIFNLVNVIFSTVRSLATIKSDRKVAALINGGYFALYYAIIIKLAVVEGIPMWEKATIIFVENVIGVYLADWLYNKFFTKDVRWEVRVSVPLLEGPHFEEELHTYQLEYYQCGGTDEWVAYAVFCDDRNASTRLKNILPSEAKYNIVEDRKRL